MYFKQVVSQYTEELTNTAKSERLIKSIEMPTITICSGFKENLMKKLKITPMIFIDPQSNTNLPKNMTPDEIFDIVTFKLNEDFNLFYQNKFLNEGINKVKINNRIYDIEVKAIQSSKDQCYAIISHDLKRSINDTFMKSSDSK